MLVDATRAATRAATRDATDDATTDATYAASTKPYVVCWIGDLVKVRFADGLTEIIKVSDFELAKS